MVRSNTVAPTSEVKRGTFVVMVLPLPYSVPLNWGTDCQTSMSCTRTKSASEFAICSKSLADAIGVAPAGASVGVYGFTDSVFCPPSTALAGRMMLGRSIAQIRKNESNF